MKPPAKKPVKAVIKRYPPRLGSYKKRWIATIKFNDESKFETLVNQVTDALYSQCIKAYSPKIPYPRDSYRLYATTILSSLGLLPAQRKAKKP